MKINSQIFRNYDIRGKVDEELNETNVRAIGQAYATLLQEKGISEEIPVGCDCRLSSPSFKKAFIEGMNKAGLDVVDIGTVMTQMVYFAQYHYKSRGGAMITASHNPKNYNGFKLGIDFSLTTGPEEVQRIRQIVEEDTYIKSEKKGEVREDNIKEAYIKDVLERVKLEKKYKIVADSHHGTTGYYNPEIFRRAGCEVVEILTNPDGNFPAGTPDPTDAKVMENLAKAVLSNKADLGLTFDGDGDRMGLADEKGHVLWNDVAIAIFSEEILERKPGSKIVYNTLCSQVVPRVIEQDGGIPIIWKTGHTFIKAKIAESGAAFGGELSGHFFFKDNAYGYDDGTYASLRILQYLGKKNLTLSQMYASFPQFISSPEIKIGCPDEKKIAVIKDLSPKFKSDFPEAKITDDTVIPGDDGVRADLPDGAIVVRASQNGPYITVKFEAQDKETYEKRRLYVRDLLKSYPDMIWADELCVNLEVLQ